MIAHIGADHLDGEGALRACREPEYAAVCVGIVWINGKPSGTQIGEGLFIRIGAVKLVVPALGIVLVLLVALLGIGLGIGVGFIFGTVRGVVTQETAEDVMTECFGTVGRELIKPEREQGVASRLRELSGKRDPPAWNVGWHRAAARPAEGGEGLQRKPADILGLFALQAARGFLDQDFRRDV